MPGSDVQRVRSRVRRPERNLAAFVKRQSARKEILNRQPVDDRHSWNRRLHRAQHLEPEAGAIFEAAAIGVRAAVLERRVKLRNEVAMGGVDFDAVEARLARPRGGGGVGRDRDGDSRLGHFLRHDGFERRLVDRMRDCRRRDGRLPANVEPGMSAAVAELN